MLTGDRDVVVMSLVIVLGRDFDWVSAHRGPAVERFGADYEDDEVAFAKARAVISKVIRRAESSPLFASLLFFYYSCVVLIVRITNPRFHT